METTDISQVSEEEENYLRMTLLLSDITLKAVRVLFDREFHPTCLKAALYTIRGKLDKLKLKHVINKAQYDLLFPRSGAANSMTFDVTLMVVLLRNFTKLSKPVTGLDKLPLSTDITPMADLARFKHYRNKLAHNDNGLIQSEIFTTAWEDISLAVGRLGGNIMENECKELKTKWLDQLTVPSDRRKKISETLIEWRETDKMYVETLAAQKVLEYVKEKSCVTVTASFGVGKTAMLQHVVLKMEEEGYDVLLVTNLHEIINFYHPKKKTVFVIDDLCGTHSTNMSILDLDRWEPVVKDIEELIKNKSTKIIVACRLQVFKDEQFESLSIFKSNVCNLLSDDFCLSKMEKQLIAEKYLNTDASEIMQYCGLFHCFPLLCKFYHDNRELSITNFFQNPYQVYKAEIEQLKDNTLISKYCALALCVMFNNALLVEVLKYEIPFETANIITKTCEACSPDKEIPMLTVFDEFEVLENTFVTKNQGVYKTVNDKLFDFLVYYFGQNIIQCLIQNAHSKLIEERFLLEEEEDMDQFIIIVPPAYHQMYIQRMVNDWSNGKVVNVFCNKNMKNPNFRQRYLSYLNTLDIFYQRKLAHTNDVDSKNTVLVQCCFLGDIQLIQWCLYHCIDKCDYDDKSPLFVASQEVFTEVVKFLLDNKANTDNCTVDETSPLFIACFKNHSAIVELLLLTKAESNKCRNDKQYPKSIACQKGFQDIVKLLLEHKADNNTFINDDTSSLVIACQNNLDIVKLLLINKSDIDKCVHT